MLSELSMLESELLLRFFVLSRTVSSLALTNFLKLLIWFFRLDYITIFLMDYPEVIVPEILYFGKFGDFYKSVKLVQCEIGFDSLITLNTSPSVTLF